jgi:hypothetical protein
VSDCSTITTVLVQEFYFGDLDHTDAYAQSLIEYWLNSDEGRWLKANSVKPLWYTVLQSYAGMGKWHVQVFAEMEEVAETYYLLKYR